MSETDETAWKKTVVQVFSGDTPRFVAEVDEHIPAKDNVESALRASFFSVDDVDPGEANGLTQIVEDLPALVFKFVEIARDEFG